MVFLHLKPKQSSISLRKYTKLTPRYCGPCEITREINNQAYKLFVPPHLEFHNVFHDS
eukprot:c44232_g1_i1 orf=492-665(+)